MGTTIDLSVFRVLSGLDLSSEGFSLSWDVVFAFDPLLVDKLFRRCGNKLSLGNFTPAYFFVDCSAFGRVLA